MEQKRLTKGFSVTLRANLSRLALTFWLAVAAATYIPTSVAQESTTAPDQEGYIPYIASQNPMGWNIPYKFIYASDDPSYEIALKAMEPTYKGKLDFNPRPLIGMAQVNLNQDSLPEIIAFPTEEEEETGRFCNLGTLCPHYVIEIGDKEAVTLGILYGWKVNKGKRILNGYYTLEVYSLTAQEKQFEEFAFDLKRKEYRPVAP